MRKFLISIVFMSQVWEGSAMSSLVPEGFFDSGEERFRATLNEAIRDVQQGESTPENAIIIVGAAYSAQLESIREGLNQAFLERIPQVEQNSEMQCLIGSGQHEVNVLKAQINDKLLQESSLKFFETELHKTDKKVQDVLSKQVQIPELLSTPPMDRMMDRFKKELNKLQEEIQNGNRTLEAAFEMTQERYGYSIDALIVTLQERYSDLLMSVNNQYEEKQNSLRAAYDEEKEVLERILEETNKLNAKLEKENVLVARLNAIRRGKALDLSWMEPQSTPIQNLDVLEKREIANAVYEKILPFSEVLNEDFELIAIFADFEALKAYLDETPINEEPIAPMEEPVCTPNNWLGNRGGVIEWNWGGDNRAWLNHNIVLWLKAMGVNDFVECWDNRAGENSYGTRYYWGKTYPQASGNYKEKKEVYDKEVSVRNAQIAHAEEVIFPLESYNKLVRQFNTFISKM